VKINSEAYFTWWGAGLLLIPTIWMASAVFFHERSELLNIVLTVVMLFGSLPYVGYVLLTVAAPDAMDIHHPRLITGVAVCILVANTASFFVGKHNNLFMTCHDFTVAGDHPPDNCWAG
jgi:presenilin-like A22 family membrane protease